MFGYTSNLYSISAKPNHITHPSDKSCTGSVEKSSEDDLPKNKNSSIPQKNTKEAFSMYAIK
ncbi:hypothetical protein AT1219_200021 [Vibrio alginolyticus]